MSACSPTRTSSQVGISTAFWPGALPSALGQQQEGPPKGRDSCHVEEGSQRESTEQVLSMVSQPVVRDPQKEWEASLSHWSVIIESPPKKGEVSYGNTGKSRPLHSERRLGDLRGFHGRVSARCNPPFVKVLGFALWVVSESEATDAMVAHVRSLGLQVHHYLEDMLWGTSSCFTSGLEPKAFFT